MWKAGMCHRMLLLVKIFVRKDSRTTVAREWRGCRYTDLLALYNCICKHVFDQMEPYCPVDGDSFPVWVLIRNAQNTNEFQDIPLNVCLKYGKGNLIEVIKLMELKWKPTQGNDKWYQPTNDITGTSSETPSNPHEVIGFADDLTIISSS